MHRGTMFVIINDKEVWKSTEFNGGMGLDCYGKDIVTVFKKVLTLENFKDMVLAFDETHHNYQDEVMFYRADEQKNAYVNEKGIKYFDYYKSKGKFNFFRDSKKGYIYTSDSNYIKNLSNKDVEIVCSNGVFILKPNQILVSDYDECINNTQISFDKKIDPGLGIEKLEISKTNEINKKIECKEKDSPDIVEDMFE